MGDDLVTGVQRCALPIYGSDRRRRAKRCRRSPWIPTARSCRCRRDARASRSASAMTTAASSASATICPLSSPARSRWRAARACGASRGATLMKTIFVMVKCDLGKAYKVADESVETVEQVSEVYSVSGQYDLLMKCYLPPEMDIGHFVVEHLQ